MSPLGPLGAFGSSITWAFASARYAQASRSVGGPRINLMRALVAAPTFVVITILVDGGNALADVTAARAAWLLASILCSYAMADSVFLGAARRLGISTALSIGTVYPLWSAIYGAVVRGERFGPTRVLGVALCLGGVIALLRLAGRTGRSERRRSLDTTGVLLAVAASLLWAGNTITVKAGAEGIPFWRVNAVRFTMALVLLTPQVLLLRPPRPAVPVGALAVPTQSSFLSTWRRMLPAIFVDAGLGSICYVYGLAHTDLAVAATLSSLSPLVSVPVAIAMGEERWHPARAAAVAVTVGGVVTLILGA